MCKRQFLNFPPHQTSVVSHFEKADLPAAEAPRGGGAYLEDVRRVCSGQASGFAWAGRTDGCTAGSEEATAEKSDQPKLEVQPHPSPGKTFFFHGRPEALAVAAPLLFPLPL